MSNYWGGGELKFTMVNTSKTGAVFWATGSLSYSSDTMRYTLYSITSSNEARLHWFLNIADTVEPPLSGHPQGTGKWPLNECWPLIEVCQK